jgi:hypothetical protein
VLSFIALSTQRVFLTMPFGVAFSELRRVWSATSLTVDGERADASHYKKPQTAEEALGPDMRSPGAMSDAYVSCLASVVGAWGALLATIAGALGNVTKLNSGVGTLTYSGYTYDVMKIVEASARPASATHALELSPGPGGLYTYQNFESAPDVLAALADAEPGGALHLAARLAALDYEMMHVKSKAAGIVAARYALTAYIGTLLGLPDNLAWSDQKHHAALAAHEIRAAHASLVKEPTVESAAQVVQIIPTLFVGASAVHDGGLWAALNVSRTAPGVGFLRALLAHNAQEITETYDQKMQKLQGAYPTIYELAKRTEGTALDALWKYAANDAAVVLDLAIDTTPEPSAEDLVRYAAILEGEGALPLRKMIYSQYFGSEAVNRALRNPRVGVEERGVLVATLAGSAAVGATGVLYSAYTDRMCRALGKAHRERADEKPLPLFGGDDDPLTMIMNGNVGTLVFGAPAGEFLAELSRLWRAGVGSARDLVAEYILSRVPDGYRRAIWALRVEWDKMAEVVVRVASTATFRKGVLTYGGASLDLARVGELVESPAPAELARALDANAILVRMYEGTTESAVRQSLADAGHLAALELVLERAMQRDTDNTDSELARARGFIGSLVSAAFGLPGPVGWTSWGRWHNTIVGVRNLQRAHKTMLRDTRAVNAAQVAAAILGVYDTSRGDADAKFWASSGALGTKQGIAAVESALGVYLHDVEGAYERDVQSYRGALGARARETDARDHAFVASVRLIADDASRVLARHKEREPHIRDEAADSLLRSLPTKAGTIATSALRDALTARVGLKFGARKRFV